MIFLSIARWLGLRLPRGRALIGAGLIGFLTVPAANSFFYLGLLTAPAGLAQLIFSSVPLLTLMLARLQRVEPFHLRSLIGALVGVAGVTIMLRSPAGLAVPVTGVLALVGAAACVAEASVLAKMFPDIHPVTTSAVGMTTGSVALLVLSALLGEPHAIPQLPATWYSLGFTVVFGSVVLFGLYFWLLRTYAATTAAYIFLVSPVATLALGAWLSDEQITMAVVAGGVLVIGGVYVGAILGLTSRPRSA